MTTQIDITSLDHAKLLHALYVNVYQKSAASKKPQKWLPRHERLKSETVQFVGIPTVAQCQKILDLYKGQIDFIGTVTFKINFNQQIIDTAHYDELHQTAATPEILTAMECIAELKVQREEEFKAQIAVYLNKLNREAELLISILKELTAHSDIRIKVNDSDGAYLDLKNGKILLGPAVAFVNNPPLNPSQMVVIANKVQQAGLKVKILPPKMGIGISPPKLIIDGEMNNIRATILEFLNGVGKPSITIATRQQK